MVLSDIVRVVFVVVLSCAGYFLFHVNEVHDVRNGTHYQRNGSISGIAGKLSMRRDNTLHLIRGIV